jgi:hypothetical protein
MIYIVNPSPALLQSYAEANSQPMVSHVNILATSTITDALLPADTPRIDATTEATDEYWRPGSVPATLRTTIGAARSADLAFFAAHSLGSAGATIAVQYYDGAAWQTIRSVTPPDDQPFMVLFPRRSATAWGVSMSGAIAQIGVAWIGPRLIIPGGVTPDYRPVWATRRIEKFPGVTRRGHFKGQRIERAGASVSANFMPIPHDYALNDMRDFRQHFNEGKAFVWSPAPGIFDEDVAYCWADEGQTIAPSIMAGGELVTLSMQMEAYAEP